MSYEGERIEYVRAMSRALEYDMENSDLEKAIYPLTNLDVMTPFGKRYGDLTDEEKAELQNMIEEPHIVDRVIAEEEGRSPEWIADDEAHRADFHEIVSELMKKGGNPNIVVGDVYDEAIALLQDRDPQRRAFATVPTAPET